MAYQSEPTTNKKKGEKNTKKQNNEPESVETTEDEYTQGIDRLKLGETKQESDSESKLILVQCRKFHMSSKNNNSIITKNECNALSHF